MWCGVGVAQGGRRVGAVTAGARVLLVHSHPPAVLVCELLAASVWHEFADYSYSTGRQTTLTQSRLRHRSETNQMTASPLGRAPSALKQRAAWNCWHLRTPALLLLRVPRREHSCRSAWRVACTHTASTDEGGLVTVFVASVWVLQLLPHKSLVELHC